MSDTNDQQYDDGAWRRGPGPVEQAPWGGRTGYWGQPAQSQGSWQRPDGPAPTWGQPHPPWSAPGPSVPAPPAPPGAYQAPPPPPAPPGPDQPAASGPGGHNRRNVLLVAASLVATAVVFGGAGVGVGLAVGGSSTPNQGQADTLPTPSKAATGSNTPLTVAAIAARVEPATVDITASGSQEGPDEGTGIVLTRSGLVLTNNHVVDGATKLTAQIDGAGTIYSAALLGTDPTDDVALLQLHGGSSFKTVTLGNSTAMAVGDQVVAIGNALALSGPETVTSGIISATGRSISVSDPSSGAVEDLKGLFQTSASINPGNSGGPLVNAVGQVIGMNTASASSTGSGETASNIGFAIPINTAMGIARQIQAGKASSTIFIGPHAIIGVDVESVGCAEGQVSGCSALGDPFNGFPFGATYGYTSPVNKGAVVDGVDEGSPAAAAGLAVGDVIVSVNGDSVSTTDQLTTDLQHYKVGQDVTIGWVDQQGRAHKATMKLVVGPDL